MDKQEMLLCSLYQILSGPWRSMVSSNDKALQATGRQVPVELQMWCSQIHVWHLFLLHIASLIFLTTRSMMTSLMAVINFFKIPIHGVGEVRSLLQKTI